MTLAIPGSRLLAAILLAVAGCAGVASAQETAPLQSQAIAQEVRVAPGTLNGRILLRGTREIVGRQALRIQRVGSPDVVELSASPAGTYETPSLDPGGYLLEVSDGLVIKLVVTRGAVIRTLDLVVPPQAVRLAALKPDGTPAGDTRPAEPPPAAEPSATTASPAPWMAPSGFSIFGLSTPVSWAIVGAGAVAVAVPVGIALSDSGGSSESVVSAVVSPSTR